MEQIDRGGGGEELHVRRRRERRARIALGDDRARSRLRRPAGWRCELRATCPFISELMRSGERVARWPRRRAAAGAALRARDFPRPALGGVGDGSEQNQKERECDQSRGPNRHRMRGTFLSMRMPPRCRCRVAVVRAPRAANHNL